MKIVCLFFLVFLSVAFTACEKNTVSPIPSIALIGFEPASDSMIVNVDTCAIEFSLTDGDGDIGNSSTSQIYIKDSRFDSLGFVNFSFPTIDGSIESPKYGLQGTCIFFPVPQPTPRLDSIHLVTGDTLTYELYITDRAGHQSNHIITPRLIIRP